MARNETRAQNSQPPFGKEVNEAMTEKEQMTMLIDCYTNLQRIMVASDKEKEIAYQLKTVKAKLEALGVVTEDLDIH